MANAYVVLFAEQLALAEQLGPAILDLLARATVAATEVRRDDYVVKPGDTYGEALYTKMCGLANWQRQQVKAQLIEARAKPFDARRLVGAMQMHGKGHFALHTAPDGSIDLSIGQCPSRVEQINAIKAILKTYTKGLK